MAMSCGCVPKKEEAYSLTSWGENQTSTGHTYKVRTRLGIVDTSGMAHLTRIMDFTIQGTWSDAFSFAIGNIDAERMFRQMRPASTFIVRLPSTTIIDQEAEKETNVEKLENMLQKVTVSKLVGYRTLRDATMRERKRQKGADGEPHLGTKYDV